METKNPLIPSVYGQIGDVYVGPSRTPPAVDNSKEEPYLHVVPTGPVWITMDDPIVSVEVRSNVDWKVK